MENTVEKVPPSLYSTTSVRLFILPGIQDHDIDTENAARIPYALYAWNE